MKAKKSQTKTTKKSNKKKSSDLADLEETYIKAISELYVHDNIPVHACQYDDISNGYYSQPSPYTCRASQAC
jgi:hypothetical protein